MYRHRRPGSSLRRFTSVLVASVTSIATPIATSGALAQPAAADGDDTGAGDSRWPELSYLWNGGAVPFFWAPIAGTMAMNRWVSPRSEPLGFSASEGGAQPASWTLPNWPVLGSGAAAGLAMGLSGDAAGWYHAKGLAQSLATGELITTSLKLAIGRHRPDWSPDDTRAAQDKSFPSGHATKAFAIATYAALYLHEHVFDELQGGKLLVGGVQGLTYGALGAAATWVALERVRHHRHFASDVLVGSALGAAESTLFFFYQEHRFRHRDRAEPALAVVPAGTGAGAALQLGGVF